MDETEEITPLDVEMAVDAWVMIREMVRMRDSLEEDTSGREEC